jgi:mannonate dehydratase
MKKLLDFAAIYQIKSGMHGPTDISPVGQAAALHLGLALHNFGIQEYMSHSEAALEVFQTSYTFSGGLLHPGETPGLGVTIDHEAAAAHPYVQAYLPVNRLTDGTMHDW